MQLMDLCKDAFLIAPVILYFIVEGLNVLIILPSRLTDLHLYSSFKQAQLLNGFDLGEFIIFLKLPLHLLVVFERQKVFQDTEILSFIVTHQVF